MTKDEFEDAKTLWKMIYAYHCFRNVENACSFILDQKMDEGIIAASIYFRCAAVRSAMVLRTKCGQGGLVGESRKSQAD